MALPKEKFEESLDVAAYTCVTKTFTHSTRNQANIAPMRHPTAMLTKSNIRIFCKTI